MSDAAEDVEACLVSWSATESDGVALLGDAMACLIPQVV